MPPLQLRETETHAHVAADNNHVKYGTELYAA